MTGKQFYNSLAHQQKDILQLLLEALVETGTPYCVIGGLAVNAYVEPVVSLDVDLVVAVQNLVNLMDVLETSALKIERFEHSLNLSQPDSDLRIQIQTDPRYQAFISRAVTREVLGYEMMVACQEDVLQGKVWAYSDPTRRRSKRQKDLADILRLIEAYPQLKRGLPQNVREEIER